MELVDYLPYYHRGICFQGQQENAKAIEDFNREEQLGAIKRTALHKDLIRRRGEAQSAEAARLAREARRRMQQLVREAQELGRRRAWDEALALLAQAEVLARQLDPDTLRSVTREQERLRADQKEAQDAADRARRLEQLLADGARLLEEGKATEAKVAFDEALGLGQPLPGAGMACVEPQHALEGHLGLGEAAGRHHLLAPGGQGVDVLPQLLLDAERLEHPPRLGEQLPGLGEGGVGRRVAQRRRDLDDNPSPDAARAVHEGIPGSACHPAAQSSSKT
jgi:hypothetical protein